MIKGYSRKKNAALMKAKSLEGGNVIDRSSTGQAGTVNRSSGAASRMMKRSETSGNESTWYCGIDQFEKLTG